MRPIVERCMRGDREAFAQLVALHADYAHRTAYLIVRRRELAEDAVQEAFLQAYRTIGGLRNPDTFRMWFYRILVRQCGKQLRKTGRELRNEDEDVLQRIAAPLPGHADSLIAQQEHERLYRAIGELPEEFRVVLVLYYWQDLSVKEIAQATGTFAATVKTRLHRAKRRLAGLLAAVPDDGAGRDAIQKSAQDGKKELSLHATLE